ncbi:MAG: DUF2723 domain-containing protein [Myxococcota bacterium]
MGEGSRAARIDGWIAAIVGLGYLVLYLLTLCPIVYWYDSAEFVTAAFTLGIPHPPGYPLYTLLGHAFTWLPIEPALAVNFMSAAFAALAVSLVYLIGRQLGARPGSAFVGAGVFGGGKLFWANAVVAEVYCPGLAFMAAVLYLLLRAREGRRFSFVLAASFLAGLGLGVHMSIATLGLGFVLLVWAFDARIDRPADLAELVRLQGFRARFGRTALAGVAAAAGGLIFLYLPLRASQKPALNFGDPSTLDQFVWVVSGGTYKGWFADELDLVARVRGIFEAFQEQLLLLGLLLAIVGVVWLWRRRPLDVLAIGLMVVGNVGFFFRYQVHDLAVFFLPTTMLASCLVACGAEASIGLVARAVSPTKQAAMTRLVEGALIGFALLLAIGNYRDVDMSGFGETEEYIASMIQELPEAAIVLNFTTPPEWKYDAVFGMYVRKVLRQRTDVEVVSVPAYGPRVVSSALASGRPVYAYYPLPMLNDQLLLEAEGPAFRVRRREVTSP